jgi:hypothetical protein
MITRSACGGRSRCTRESVQWSWTSASPTAAFGLPHVITCAPSLQTGLLTRSPMRCRSFEPDTETAMNSRIMELQHEVKELTKLVTSIAVHSGVERTQSS